MQNTQGQRAKIQTYITRQLIRMCTYKYMYDVGNMELHRIKQIQDSTV
jgi:hypothetical protein